MLAREEPIAPDARVPAHGTGVLRSAGLRLLLLSLVALAPSLSSQPAPSPTAREAPREVAVVWLIGQSNAEGATAGYWLANPLAPGNVWLHLSHQTDAHIWWPGRSQQRPGAQPAWEDYRVGSLQPINNGSFFWLENVFGPEASLVDAAAERFGEAWVFKFAVPAYLDPRALPTFRRRPDQPTLFDTMLEQWRLSVEALRGQNLEPVLHGITFVHGEFDCYSYGQSDPLEFPRAYAQNLTTFIADLRAELRPWTRGTLRFAISQLHDRHLPRAQWLVPEALVRAAQQQVANADPFVGLVPTDGLSLAPELGQIHFDAAGSIRLGYALFATLFP